MTRAHVQNLKRARGGHNSLVQPGLGESTTAVLDEGFIGAFSPDLVDGLSLRSLLRALHVLMDSPAGS